MYHVSVTYIGLFEIFNFLARILFINATCSYI